MILFVISFVKTILLLSSVPSFFLLKNTIVITKFPVLKLTINAWFAQSIDSYPYGNLLKDYENEDLSTKNIEIIIDINIEKYKLSNFLSCKLLIWYINIEWNLRLNETGTYQYWESNVSKHVPDIIMSSTIIIISDNQHNVTSDVPHNSDEIVGIYMVPASF